MLTTMGIVAERNNIAFAGARVRVTKEMVSQPTRRIGTLGVEITVPGEFTDDDRRRLEAAALHCPVHHSLHPDVQIPVTFKWGE
jgi:putative redox protein